MSTKVLTRWLPSCAASRNAADHYLLLLPFVGLTGDEPPAGAVAALMALAAAALLWARGWGGGAPTEERLFAGGWVVAWVVSTTALGVALGASERPLALAALAAVGGAGLWGLSRARRARTRLVTRASASRGALSGLLAGAVLFVALLGAEAIRRAAGAPPATEAYFAAMALAAALLFALVRRGRWWPAEVAR